MKHSKHLLAAAVAASIMVPMSASATNGYFGIAYGANARGVAGAVTAMPQDSMAAAVNPAGMAHVGNRADVNVEVFSPIRDGESPLGHSVSGSDGFIIPSGGYVRNIDDKLTAGITIYANGGMNTSYEADRLGNFNLYGWPDENLGVDLAQLIFAPTIAYKINDNHTVGASLLVGYQRFKAYGIQPFCGFTSTGCGMGPGTPSGNKGLTNQGYDDAWGYGLRVGWQGKMSENVTLGAAYATKIYMDEFSKYDELFAEQGDFDIPANWSVGIAAKVTPKTTVSFDIQGIQYSDVKSIANAGPTTASNWGMYGPFSDGQGPLGADNGLGFGWDDMTIYKLGMVYEHDANFTYRLGVSHTDQPIGDGEISFNILAPAVVEDHITAGFTYRPTGKDGNEINVAFMHALHNKEEGEFLFGGPAAIEMYQNAVEIGYTWKF